jgi:hypothetical protein
MRSPGSQGLVEIELWDGNIEHIFGGVRSNGKDAQVKRSRRQRRFGEVRIDVNPIGRRP